jgi:hypothetical protein
MIVSVVAPVGSAKVGVEDLDPEQVGGEPTPAPEAAQADN